MIYIQQSKGGSYYIEGYVNDKAYSASNNTTLQAAIEELKCNIDNKNSSYAVIAVLNSLDELANLEDTHPELFL